MRILKTCIATITAVLSIGSISGGDVIYTNDFDGNELFGTGIVGAFSGNTNIESVQNFAGVGDSTNSFAGDLLRNDDNGNPQSPSTFTLTGLPTHDALGISFLLAIIDSWDGNNFPPNPSQAPDYFNVRIDGVIVFRETFTNLGSLGITQSFLGSPLVSEQDFGWGSGVNRDDSAYRIRLTGIPHSSGSSTIDFFANGNGWNTLGDIDIDESWGIDNLSVIEILQGDFDGDGDVDGADFLEWQRGFGTIYDAMDLANWEANYGFVAPLSATAVSVPEPTTSCLLLIAATCLLASRLASVV